MKALAAALLMAAAGGAGAADYVFPGTLPPGCSGSGPNYSCTTLSLGYGDTLTINAPKPATITVNGSLDTNNAQINTAGAASDLTLVVTGTLTLGYQALIRANVTAGAVSDPNGAVTFGGSLSTTSGAISLGYQTGVAGSITTDSGAVSTGQDSTVGGSITSTSGAVTVPYQGRVTGSIASTGPISIGQAAVIGGSITGSTGNLVIGYGASVGGAVQTSSGTIDIAQGATLAACVRSTSSAAITLGYQASVNSVCCGAGCSSSCVVNNSTYSMPALCGAASPTLTAGQRYSFESYDVPGSYVLHQSFSGYIAPVSAASSALTRADSSFIARAGLGNASCWSFESVSHPGYYLRHASFRIWLHIYDATALYLADATFCLRNGLADATALSFESINYPGLYIRHEADNSLVIASTDGSAAVNGRSTFLPRAAWSGPVDHYELELPATSLACQPATVAVRACSDSASPCSNLAGGLAGQSATLSTSAGTLGSTTLTFDNSGVASTTLAYPGAADASTVSVTLSGETSSASGARRCCTGGSCSAANSCSTSFRTAGFIVAASAGGSQATVPTQTAGSSSDTYYLRAVRSNSTTQACEAALSGTRSIDWALQCSDPATCSSGNLMTLSAAASGAIASNPASGITSRSALNMAFDADGNAPFSFSYADAGRVLLSASTSVNGAALTGASNSFVVKPASFSIGSVRRTASPATANPGAASADGGVFVKAGESFSLTVTALGSTGVALPNFGRESAPEGVLLSPALTLPAGGSSGTLANPSIAGGSFSSGAATPSNLSYSEVGVITLTPSVADGSYLGAGPVVGSASTAIGRFVPARFALTAGSVTHRSTSSCAPASAFSYLGETFRLGFTLTAQNAAGGTTQNYSGSFAKFALTTPSAFALAGVADATLFASAGAAPRLALGTSTGTWSNGVAAGITLSAAALRGSAADGPFNAAFGIAPVDSDGVALASFDIDADSGVAGNDHASVATVALRFGRLRLSNAIGAQDRALALPLAAQHWNGTAFDTNTLDSCTVLPASAVNFGNLRRTLTAADTAVSGGNVTLAGGLGRLLLAAPAAGHAGSVDVALSLGATATDASCLQPWTPAAGDAATAGANLAFLRGAWCGAAFDKDPTARASFGLYRGAGAVIHQRENY